MEKKTVYIPNITCGHCIMAIKNELGEIEGVKSVEGDISTKKITIRWNSPADWGTINRVLNEIGYSPEE